MSENEELEGFMIDLNTAGEEELSRLPGIGPVLATRIVEYREEVGPYQQPSDVLAVPGVTASLYDRLAGQLTVRQVESGPALEPDEPAEDFEGLAGPGPEDRPGDSLVDLNTAGEEELGRLPGIGPVLAARIVEHREEVGPFQEPSGVLAVPGIAQSLYDRFAHLLAVGQGESAPAIEPEEPEVEAEAETEAEGAERDDLEVSGPESLEVPEEEPESVPAPEEPDWDMDLEVEPEEDWLEWDESELLIPPEEEEAVEAGPPEPFEEWAEDAIPESALAFEDSEKDVPPAELEAETTEAEEPAEPVSEPPPFVVVPAPERGGCWRMLAVGLMSALAGAVISLVILLTINGTLNFQISTRQALETEVARLDGEIGTLSNGLTGLQSRLEGMDDLATELEGAQADIRRLADELTILHGTLERLAGDLDGTQAALGALTGDVEDLAGNVEELGANVEELEANVSALQTQFSAVEDQLNTLSGELDSVRQAADRFETFLDGLRTLLGETAKPTPEDSPFNLEPPPPTSAPPTREPVFTVIPLATPTPAP